MCRLFGDVRSSSIRHHHYKKIQSWTQNIPVPFITLNVYTALGVADDPVCVVDTFAPPVLRQHPLSGDIRIFQKEHFAEDKNGSVRCGFYYFPESRVMWPQSVSGCLMMFCPGRWWPRLPQILMFCAEMLSLSCHLVIRISLISAHK